MEAVEAAAIRDQLRPFLFEASQIVRSAAPGGRALSPKPDIYRGARRALSREPEIATRSPEVPARAHAAVAARHVRNASSLGTRSVLRDVR